MRDKVWNSEVGVTTFPLTVVIGRPFHSERDSHLFAHPVLSGTWKVTKKEKHRYAGWEYSLSLVDTQPLESIPNTAVLSIIIEFNSCGEMKETRAEVRQFGQQHYCVVFEEIREGITTTKIRAFMELRKNTKTVASYIEEFESLISKLNSSLKDVTRYIDRRVKKRNLYTYCRALEDIIDELGGGGSFKGQAQTQAAIKREEEEKERFSILE